MEKKIIIPYNQQTALAYETCAKVYLRMIEEGKIKQPEKPAGPAVVYQGR